MTEKELRELDAWIAEHVMGWLFNMHGIPFSPHPEDKWERETVVPRYTTDPAAAMQVLEKCIECRSVVTNKEPTGRVSVVELKMGALGLLHTAGAVTADTLPLAICLFSRKLFSK